MPPIALIFTVTGAALWVISTYFLGWGSRPAEGSGPDPLRTVGVAALVAGLVDIIQAVYIVAARPDPLGEQAVVLSGLVGFYGLFFTVVGVAAIWGMDLRPVGNLAIVVGVVPLFWWNFFAGGWLFRSILVVWAVAFLAVTLTVYARLSPRALGAILLATSVYTFFVPPVLLALGRAIP
ncbi:hypothetical protein ACFQE5_19120 [Pseudonocardia hispaniensis]|uniref:AmiS/UreI family transporter n=1 Tax=Pseudonocardia hispaniensis TaxID=904933 RepID=A0ABW1J6P3_9PSEU